MKRCDIAIVKTLDLVEKMLQVADEGEIVRKDPGCGVLFGVVRDSAYRIKQLAEGEKTAHIRKGWWKG